MCDATAPYWSETARTRRPASVEEAGGIPADLAEALHRRGGTVDADPARPQRRERNVHDASRRGGGAAERTSEADRLAGGDAEDRVALLHRVGVHHPGHGLLVGADVGGGDVVRGADQRADLAGVAAGHPLELGGAVTTRVDADAALGAAVGHVEQGALPRHPHREGAYLVEGDVGRVAKAALGRSAGEVVLHAVADEQLDLAAVAAQRDADGHFATGVASMAYMPSS